MIGKTSQAIRTVLKFLQINDTNRKSIHYFASGIKISMLLLINICPARFSLLHLSFSNSDDAPVFSTIYSFL